MVARVSVIVPVHDVADHLEQCVTTLLEQTLRDVEVVLVDDGSSDGSAVVCDALARADERVVVLRQENGGVSAARNAGLQAARGRYVTFLDGDDWSEPTMLREMVDAAETSGAEVVIAGCHVDVVDDEGHLTSTRAIVPGSAVLGPKRPPPAVTAELVNLLGYVWNKLYSGELLRRGAFEFAVDTSLGEDMLFNADVLTTANPVALLDRPFVHYVQRPRGSLGTVTRPDFLELRLQAIAGVRAVLAHWAVDATDADAVVASLQVDAVRALARTTSACTNLTFRRRTAHLRDARRGVDGVVRSSHLAARRRVELWLLRHAPAVAVVLAFRARDRWRRPAAARRRSAG